MKTLQLSHMKERVQQLGNNISKHAKNAAGAVATTLLMMQANPDAAVAQGLTSDRIEINLGSAYVDKFIKEEVALDAFGIGYTRDTQGWDSKNGFQFGGEINHVRSEEAINSKFSSTQVGFILGGYRTIFARDSYGDYFESGTSLTANMRVSLGGQYTELTNPIEGENQGWSPYVAASVGTELRRRNEDFGFAIGPYFTAHLTDKLENLQSGKMGDYIGGVKAVLYITISD